MKAYMITCQFPIMERKYVVVAEDEHDAKILVQEAETCPAQRGYPAYVPSLDNMDSMELPGVYGRVKGIKCNL